MVTIEGALVILIVGIALILIARLALSKVEPTVAQILYIVGIIIAIIGALLLILAVLGYALPFITAGSMLV